MNLESICNVANIILDCALVGVGIGFWGVRRVAMQVAAEAQNVVNFLQ